MSSGEIAHAQLSASGSERWLNCAASVKLSEQAPPQKESAYAKEGTDAHACLEMILKNHGSKVYTTVRMLKKQYPETMVDHAFAAYKEIVERVPPGAELLSETKVDLTFVGPDMFGTVDAAIVDEFGTLHVIDFKYGAGVAVDPEENTQLIYYALGIAYKYHFNFERVLLTIIQPRAEHSGGPVREWEMSIEDLRGWITTFKDGAARALRSPEPEFAAGDWCRWCPAKAICPELSGKSLAAAQIEFSDEGSMTGMALPVVNMIPPKQLGETLTALEKIDTWSKAVREHAMEVLERGGEIPGFKLVKKRSTRKWVNEEKVALQAKKTWGKHAFTLPELISPAQMEKKFPKAKDWVAERVSDESSGVTLAPESDPRPAYNAALEFPIVVTVNESMGVTMTAAKSVKTHKKTKMLSKPKRKK